MPCGGLTASGSVMRLLQSGQIMQAAALLSTNPGLSEGADRRGMNGNLCRCATYPRIVGAVKRAAEIFKGGASHA
jgi:isoquinoline 1-oxidoreductase alpha subunit